MLDVYLHISISREFVREAQVLFGLVFLGAIPEIHWIHCRGIVEASHSQNIDLLEFGNLTLQDCTMLHPREVSLKMGAGDFS